MRKRLAPGGRIAVTVQPRSKGATAESTEEAQAKIEWNLKTAGFESMVAHWLDLNPPAVCVIGVLPEA